MISFLGTLGRLLAFGVVLLAVFIAFAPGLIYIELPTDLTLDISYRNNNDNHSPITMVVTGANSGVGLATVEHFAHSPNTKIIMACRSESKCASAKNSIFRNLQENVRANLVPMQLDLSEKSSIENFAQQLQKESIHILINNAGLAGVTDELTYHKEDGVENHIRVNHLGHVYLTHCLWKNLQMAEKARIVIVPSLLAALPKNIPTHGWYKGEEPPHQRAANLKLYGRSKRANLMFAAELHERYGQDNAHHQSGITVVAAHPGATHTGLCEKGCKGQNELGRRLAVSNLFVGTFKMASEDGALPQAYAAVVPQGGVYIGPKWGLVGAPVIVGGLTGSWHHASFTKDESQELWTKSLAAMQIKEFGEFDASATANAANQNEEMMKEKRPQEQQPVNQNQHREIPVREEPVHREGQEEAPMEAEDDAQQQQHREPEPAQVYEYSEVNEQMHHGQQDHQHAHHQPEETHSNQQEHHQQEEQQHQEHYSEETHDSQQSHHKEEEHESREHHHYNAEEEHNSHIQQ